MVQLLAYIDRVMAEHIFTNKYGKHKRWCNDTFKMSKPQYSQIILTQIQSPLSTQKLGLNTKFRVAPNTKISFFFSAQTFRNPSKRSFALHFATPLAHIEQNNNTYD